jgi:hypothetical protein
MARAPLIVAMRSTAAFGIPARESDRSSRWTENGVKNSPQLG